ncbi:glycoside hydrolase N-terminal domain-containing protein [Tenacibaculum sp. UWU-22]|uniref:glycoside hydrolase family 95 protein n=1 Tax=Tenacibaculum sp. UWU-22 TaxID=3234187 RepID=UPI0034DB4BE6
MKKVIIIFLTLSVSVFGCSSIRATKQQQQLPPLKLWYKQPANPKKPDASFNRNKDDIEWLKALPVGNGTLGAMVFGGVNYERIQLNEKTVWSGSPSNDNNPEAFPAQAKIRKFLFEGKYKEASELTKKTQICKGPGTGGSKKGMVPFGCYQTLGDLWIDFEKKQPYENYYRELDLEDAVAKVTYTQDGVKYKREIFASEPDNLLVIKISADKPGMISFKSTLTRPERFKTKAAKDQLIMQGKLFDGKGGDGLEYMARLSAINKNGTVKYVDSSLIVKNADEVVLLLTASTDYLLKYPTYKGRPYKEITKTTLEKGEKIPYEELLKKHEAEYQQYFNRVAFKLTKNLADTIPTDLRVKQFDNKKPDLHLTELFFQYGRYLLISSSRPGSLPANLQGIWANKILTAWDSDYHTDVNVEMNYWPAEVTNLSEMHLPLFDFTEELRKPGNRTAREQYHLDGWVVHPTTNVWGFTSPGQNPSWGMHVTGGAWLTTHIMEHYYFTLDKEFLKKRYPILKQSTEFYMGWLIPDPKTGELISGPSVSPENTFIAPDGTVCQISMGPAHDQEVIWQLFKNFIDASDVLGIHDSYVQKVIEAQKKLAKPKIGTDGRLMEWREEFKEREPGHRHISHLFALYPGYQIDLDKTPKFAEAVRKSLDYRISHGGGHTGWSAAWLINEYARLRDGEKAENFLNSILNKKIFPNLFARHPPFQMDANFGSTAGIAEMLIQSQSGEIRLLPALPKDWKDGEVTGLCARGGFVIDLKWESNNLTYVRVFSKNGGLCKLDYKGKEILLNTEKGKEYFPLKG